MPLPQNLPTLSNEQMMDVLDLITEAHERSEMRCQSLRLHECELPWFADHIKAVAAARAANPLAPFRAAA